MIITAFKAFAIIIAIMSFFALYKAYDSTTAADRVVAIAVISTKVTVLIVLTAVILEQDVFVDVALVYSMLSFMTTICVAKYVEKGKLY